MINQKCFQKEWLDKIKTGKYPDVDITLLERTIHAFELLGLLSQTKNKFIFKGGTALILLLPELKRLSIDIDVLGNFDDKTYESIITDSVFTRYEVDKRTSKNIPKQQLNFSITLFSIKKKNTYFSICWMNKILLQTWLTNQFIRNYLNRIKI